ncbi:hypothetical protein BDU57DRAFT_525338 [Ampelomyces quisqualis]|uniref:Uncharacterized protein n=1 Tax=Ampelomyces quisqualis TaxID=50730 RepID=A0A6A5QWQ1_AMPQU|nr:hypothetical protein BDU57DRAFT_525338 [Ampelomyces quisqualis]
MFVSRLLLTGFVALASASSLHADDAYFATLLKRQAPGTPSFNCHDNCGTAITLSRQTDKCDNVAFKSNYANCLQCSGPDNYNIWRMYGNTLSSAGASCGLATEPLAGKQSDVGPAVHASSSSSAAASGSAAPVTTPAPASASASSSAVVPGSITSAPVASRNTTASSTSSAPLQQSTNAGALVAPAGILGAIVAGAMAVL